jgi:hypothetical protein
VCELTRLGVDFLTRLGVDFVLAAHDDLTPGGRLAAAALPIRRTGGDLLNRSVGKTTSAPYLNGNDHRVRGLQRPTL